MIPYIEAAPLDGFDLPHVPTTELLIVASGLSLLAHDMRATWPDYASKLSERAALLEAKWVATALAKRGGA